jgi:hypothetical protein
MALLNRFLLRAIHCQQADVSRRSCFTNSVIAVVRFHRRGREAREEDAELSTAAESPLRSSASSAVTLSASRALQECRMVTNSRGRSKCTMCPARRFRRTGDRGSRPAGVPDRRARDRPRRPRAPELARLATVDEQGLAPRCGARSHAVIELNGPVSAMVSMASNFTPACRLRARVPAAQLRASPAEPRLRSRRRR